MSKYLKSVAVTVSFFISVMASAQLSGVKTIPGDFPSVAAAVDTLNLYGVGPGGVTFDIATAYSETLSTKIILTATGTAADPIVFQKSGTGANPVLVSYPGLVGTQPSILSDGFFVLAGSDYVTIDGLDLQENASNTTTITSMEFGYALVKASASDGAQYNTIRNCTVSLNRVQAATWSAPGYNGSCGIVVLNSLATATGTVSVTSASGSNSYNRFHSNIIRNSHAGIVLYGFNDPNAPYSFTDMGNDIGGTSASTGNSIVNFGGNPSPNSAATAGIYLNFQSSVNCRFNTINNNNGSGVNNPNTLRGIYWLGNLAASSGSCSNNTITLTSAGTNQGLSAIDCGNSANSARTINLDSNTISLSYPTATSGTCYGIYTTTTTPGTLTVNGNSISVSSAASTGSMYAVYNTAQPANTHEIKGNTVSSFVCAGAAMSGAMRVFYSTGGAATCTTSISDNRVSGVSYTGATGGSSEFSVINNTGAVGSMTISGNSADSLDVKTTGVIYFISNSYAAPANGQKTVQGNSVNFRLRRTVTGTPAGAMYGYFDVGSSPSTAVITVSGNTFNGLSNTPSTGALGGIHVVQTSNAPSVNVTGNTLAGLTCGTGALNGINLNGLGGSASSPCTVSGNTISTLTGAGTVNGVTVGSQAAYTDVNRNTVHTLSSSGASAVTGINTSGSVIAASITRNKVYGLAGTDLATVLNGITVSGGGPCTMANNLVGISGLSGFIATGLNSVVGLNITGGSTVNAYHNTVYLAADGTTSTCGTSGIFCNASVTLSLINNLVVNKSLAAGTGGLAVAFRRSAGTNGVPVSTTFYTITSNNNLFFAGAPDPAHLLYSEGVGAVNTNSLATLADYKNFMLGRDRASCSYDASSDFVSVAGSSPSFLHIANGTYTVLSDGGSPVSDVTVDYDGVSRSTSRPDIGAVEFTGTSPSPTVSNIQLTPGVSCTPVSHTVSVDVTPVSGTVTDVTLEYAYNGSLMSPVAMVNTGLNTWTGVIPAASPGYATVTWNVTANTSTGENGGVNGTTYQDDPLNGAIARVTASPTAICPGASVTLQASALRPGAVSTGAGSTTASTSAANPFNNTASNGHFQYLIRAAELTGAGLAPGDITSLSVSILTLTAPPYNLIDFSLKMANTSSTTVSSPISPSWTTVYTNSNILLSGSGSQTFTVPFTVPFTWDGVSNIVLEMCYGSAVITTTMAGSVQADATSYASSWRFISSSGSTAATVCGTVAGGSTANSRPKFTFNGYVAVPVNSLSWSDGTSVVGTTSPLPVTPAATTTYSATLTGAGGCTVSGSVPVTVYPVVPAPAGTDSVQCGTGLSLCRVTSVSGAATPVFRWYAAPTGGTPLQSSTSPTYSTPISSTTTFYVSEYDGNCESSPRIAVTETVSVPPVLTVTSAQTICQGDSVVLSAGSSNDPGNRYTWTPGPLSGATVTVSPSLTTTYTVSALDTTVGGLNSGCNNSATVAVTVVPLPAPVIVTPSSAALCTASGVTLTATGGTLGTVATVGTGTIRNSVNTYPAPFGNFNLGARHQFLVRASELSAAGLLRGPVVSLAFDVVVPSTSPLSNFVVRLGHTSITAFNPPGTGFQSGLTDVYSVPSYTPSSTPGYSANTIVFNTPFFWDGVSNLIIETCFSNTTSALNATFNQSTTTFASSISYQNNSINICGNSTVFGNYSQRPNMKVGGLRVNSWSWSPGGDTTAAVTVIPSQTTNYTVVSTLDGCSSSGSATVTVPSGTFLSVSAASTDITCFGANDGTASVSVSGGSGSSSLLWSNGSVNDSISGLSTGSYSVTVSDSNGCTGSATVNIAQPALLTMTAVPVSTQICGTGDSTDVTVTASGGTLPYSGTGVFPQGPDTAVYVVHDNNGCSASDTVIVNSPRYFITATSNGNGTITNPGTVQYYCGDTVTFSFTPADTCTRIVNVSVNGVAQGPVSSYTFNGLSSSGVISVSFGPVRYTVTANAGSGGLISGASSPVCGTDAVYTIVPNSCYQIADVLVDGVSVGPVTTYTFPAISAAHAISATFTQLSYTVTVISDSGGTATPLGTVTYACGDTVTVQFLPDPFKLVDSVVVDGVNIGPLNDYVFYGLDGNHTVLVYFSGCAVPAEVAAPDFAQLCLAQGSYQLDGTFSGSATYAFWSTSGSGVFDDPTVGVGTTYTPSAADIVAGSVYLFIVTDDPDGSGDCLAGTDSTLLTITSTVTVTINGPTSFCTGDTIVLTASGATDYVWFRNTTVNQIAQTASITTSLPGTYYVDGSIQGNCASSSQITVVEHPVPSVPVITPLTSTEFCYGDNVSLVSSYTTGNVWQDGDTAGVYLAMAGGFYRVTYTDPNGCSSVSDSVEVIVHPIPVVDILGLDSVYCLNAPDVSLTGSPSGGDFSGVAVISDVFYPGLAGAGFYLITYQFMDTNSCVGIDSQLVQVDICSEVPEIADPEMAVYPNPAHDRFAVSIGGFTSASTEYTVEITDQLGRRVLVLRADREVIYVSTETLYGPGLYLVRLTDSDGRIIRTKKVVVQ